jgi:hypothetical protein
MVGWVGSAGLFSHGPSPGHQVAIPRETLNQPSLPLTVLFKQQFGRDGATFMLACDRAVSAKCRDEHAGRHIRGNYRCNSFLFGT